MPEEDKMFCEWCGEEMKEEKSVMAGEAVVHKKCKKEIEKIQENPDIVLTTRECPNCGGNRYFVDKVNRQLTCALCLNWFYEPNYFPD